MRQQKRFFFELFLLLKKKKKMRTPPFATFLLCDWVDSPACAETCRLSRVGHRWETRTHPHTHTYTRAYKQAHTNPPTHILVYTLNNVRLLVCALNNAHILVPHSTMPGIFLEFSRNFLCLVIYLFFSLQMAQPAGPSHQERPLDESGGGRPHARPQRAREQVGRDRQDTPGKNG